MEYHRIIRYSNTTYVVCIDFTNNLQLSRLECLIAKKFIRWDFKINLNACKTYLAYRNAMWRNPSITFNASVKWIKTKIKRKKYSKKNVSLERRWSLEVSIEKAIGRDASFGSGREKEVETNIPILEREYMQGVLISEVVVSNTFSPRSRKAKRRQRKLAKEVKRPGEAIIKGHRSYDLMLSLQLGIRYIHLLYSILAKIGKILPNSLVVCSSFWVIQHDTIA